MLDEIGSVTQSPLSEDWGLSRAKGWELKLCWLPRKCFLSEKPLWGKRAYVADRYIHGPGEPVMQTYWIEKSEFIFWNLRGKK